MYVLYNYCINTSYFCMYVRTYRLDPTHQLDTQCLFVGREKATLDFGKQV